MDGSPTPPPPPVPPQPNLLPPPPAGSGKSIALVVIVVVLGLCLAGMGLLAAILFPVFQQAKVAAQRTTALERTKMNATALLIYTSDFDDHFPPASSWQDLTRMYRADASEPPPESNLAFRDRLSRKAASDVDEPNRVAVLFDTTETGRNAHGDFDQLPQPPRWSGKHIFAFVDGSARALSPEQLEAKDDAGKPLVK